MQRSQDQAALCALPQRRTVSTLHLSASKSSDQEHSKVKERLAKSVFWITWCRGAGFVVSFLSSLVVARLLSPADYGLMAMASIWTGIMSLISEMGLGAAIVQFQELQDDELNSCFW